MWIAIVLQKPINTSKPDWTVNCSYIGDTPEGAGASAEKQAEACRKTLGSHQYQVVLGEVTKRIKPPESNITLEDYKL